MTDEWERPPPKLVRGKRKFPRYFIYLIIGLYFGAVIVTWAVAGKQLPIDVILEAWLLLIAFLALALMCVWWALG
jgi:hypothetical protein